MTTTEPLTARTDDEGLRSALQNDLNAYLKMHQVREHVSAAAVTIDLRGAARFLTLSAGTTEYSGSKPVPTDSLWQIGSITKSFTAAMLLQLEGENQLSVEDEIGSWLRCPEAWTRISIRQLLNMTSGIANYEFMARFQKAYLAEPHVAIPILRLIELANGVPLKRGFHYTSTAYLLAQLIAERVTRDVYASQLEKRFVRPLALGDVFFNPEFNPPSLNERMPAGYYFYKAKIPFARLLGSDVRAFSVSMQQGAGGVVATTEALTKWVRALFGGHVLAQAQQGKLVSLVSMKTGSPIPAISAAEPRGFGFGIAEVATNLGTLWFYEGRTLGYRVLYVVHQQSDAIVTFALNSVSKRSSLPFLFKAIFKTLQKAGRV